MITLKVVTSVDRMKLNVQMQTSGKLMNNNK